MMTQGTLVRVWVEAQPADARAALARFEPLEAEDAEFGWLGRAWAAGQALPVRIVLAADVRVGRRTARVATAPADAWIERASVPAVEAQIAEAAGDAVPALIAQVGELCDGVAEAELERSFVHVDLDPRLQAALAAPPLAAAA